MKIIYLTDIHGSFSNVATLLFETVADVYIVSGDLIDLPFYSIETSIHYYDLQTFFNGARRNMGMNGVMMEDFVDKLMEMPNTSDEIQDMGSKYQQLTIRARRVMQQKYKVLENILSTKTSARIFSIPGNYDMDLKFTSLHERDLHLRWYMINGLKIAGYGGAAIWTTGIPQKYVIEYNAGIGVDDKKNEMYVFFKAIKPDIIVTHQPAQGVLDRHIARGLMGSPALRTFCDNNPVKLCLTGHMHNDWGLRYVENTIYMNPSNFGEVTSTEDEPREGGFFFEIEIDETTVSKIMYRKLANERIYDIAEYYVKDTTWQEKIIDSDRYNALMRNENYDSKMVKFIHIPEIDLFKDIKKFFRLFQTPETEMRLKDLEQAIDAVKLEIADIALDIVGSVNMGISKESSDIDVVLYIKCGSTCPDLNEQCAHFRNARDLIKESLGGKYKFEIIDCIDLNIIENSIRTQDYECIPTQRFVTYRGICRPINYQVIAPIEDMLNRNLDFRREMEGSVRSYFKIFATTTQHTKSFEKYEARLKTIGIKIPKQIRNKIKEYLQQDQAL